MKRWGFFSYLDTLRLLLRFIIFLCFFICTFLLVYCSVSVSYCISMESWPQKCFLFCWCCSLLIHSLLPSPGAAGAAGQHQRHLGGGANGQQPQPEHGADRGWGQSPVRGDRSPQPRGGRGLVQEQSKEETGVIGNTAYMSRKCPRKETQHPFCSCDSVCCNRDAKYVWPTENTSVNKWGDKLVFESTIQSKT